jgi:hypothetical protein
MEYSEKAALAVLGLGRQGETAAWRSRKPLPQGKMQLAESRCDGRVYNEHDRGLQNEIAGL